MDRLLACDMDGTVIPLVSNPQTRAAVEEFKRLVSAEPALGLAYVSGRHLALAVQGVREFALPEPDFLSCDVGTSLYRRSADGWVTDTEYAVLMRASLGELENRDLARLLDPLAGLLPQEELKQARFKRSYYLEQPQNSRALLVAVRRRLADQGLSANLVFSVDPLSGMGLLDVLPQDVAKHTVLEYLRRKLGMEQSDLLFAGDSGNDVEALTSGVSGILVGNARSELKLRLQRLAATPAFEHRLYIAVAGYTAGVIEGCRHFGLFSDFD